MRSSLGLRRISDIDVTQLLTASTTDLHHLRQHLSRWNVPTSFSNYSLLLRALTHPSMSNWAERTLTLPKRSLSPNTLELLGDRVLGVCAAAHVHAWIRADADACNVSHTSDLVLNKLQPWSTRFGATSIVASLVGNRGLAIAAKDAGIDELIRWEKPLPPAAHRARLNEHGIDRATGLPVNREVNALAAAYEAVTAAIYLDGGYSSAHSFIKSTLIPNLSAVQKANMGLAEYQQVLTHLVSKWAGFTAAHVELLGVERGTDDAQSFATAKVQCGVIDLEPMVMSEEQEASPVYYAGVVLRSRDRADEAIRQGDLLSVASHFSIDMARIAAATQAVELLQGRRTAMVRRGTKLHCSRMQLVAVTGGTGGDEGRGECMDVEFVVDSGKWVGDGDYARLAYVLDKIDVGGMGEFAKWEGSRGEELKVKVGDIFAARMGDVEGGGEFRGEGMRSEQLGGNVRRRRARKIGSGLICERSVGECLEVGGEILSRSKLHCEHEQIVSREISASDICSAIYSTIQRLNERDGWWQVAELRGYNCVGANAVRLWSVEGSMDKASQERGEVVAGCEERMQRGVVVERMLVQGEGGMEFGEVYMGKIRKGLVGLGIVVERFGTDVAVRWMAGAEAVERGRRMAK